MLQAIGLTSAPRRDLPPAVDDLSFQARPGQITALLGAAGAGKSTALRLMLDLEPGRGVTYFRGNRLHRIAHPAREVGVLLGDVPGHPARTVRGQLRMLCAAEGVPTGRADELIETMGLAGLRDERLGVLPLAMDRRLGVATALLGDPQALVLDEPSKGLSPRERGWLYGLLRSRADSGGTVLLTTGDPKEAARLADRVVTLDAGRLVADQEASEFSRTRLRPRVAVRTPHAVRLADLVHREARAAQRSVEVVTEGGGLLSVYGSTCADVGETAFRHGVLVHRLTDETGDTGTPPPSTGRSSADGGDRRPPGPEHPAGGAEHRALDHDAAEHPAAEHPDRLSGLRPMAVPRRPVRYELRRILGVRTAALIAVAAVLTSVTVSLLLARSGSTPLPVALAAWPEFLPLPPAAFCAGLIGALSFGEEFRYPALASVRGTVPRRLGLLLAKLLVTGVAALLIALLVAVVDAQALRLAYGGEMTELPGYWPAPAVSWGALSVGCAWAGLLAAGTFRVTAAGVAAVLAVPVVVAPLVQKVLVVPSARPVAGLPARLRELAWVRLPHQLDGWLTSGARLVAQPVGVALMLSLSVLICAYVMTALRPKARR
ncbi:ATP-binding cassette domain-containing protein [Streptomyces sp. NPDC051018]|uniref:ATP-binding cassette domain-containing protein n=1 Tax=Streptomyces sp. NPDC051018 TaxID=3365639 RepID=UPI00378C68C3